MADARGFFDDGTKIGLNDMCRLDPQYQNQPTISVVTNANHKRVFRVGLDYLTMRVFGQVERHSQGDAEWRAYVLLNALGESGLGTLCVEGWKFADTFFVEGKCDVICGAGTYTNLALLNYDLTFVRSVDEKTVSLTARGADAFEDEPAEYASRNSNRTYTFDGTSLGLVSERGLEISVRREVVMNPIPKCYGVLIDDRAFGLEMTFDLTTHQKFDTHGEWNEWWMELITNKGDAPLSLVGNGNTWTNCHLQDAQPARQGDQWAHVKAGNVRMSFVKDLN